MDSVADVITRARPQPCSPSAIDDHRLATSPAADADQVSVCDLAQVRHLSEQRQRLRVRPGGTAPTQLTLVYEKSTEFLPFALI